MQSSEALRQLHHHDRRLDFISRRLAELPQALAAMDTEATQRGEADRRRAGEAAELAEALRRLERESAVLRQELKRLEAQQSAVTGMEALKASQAQIRHCQERLSSVEETMLVKLEAQEIHARESSLRAQRQEQEALALAAERQALLDEQAACEGERAESLAQRQALLDSLPPADARLYLRVFSSHGHRSLTALRGAGCSALGAALPPQELLEIKQAQRVITCQGCGRLVLLAEGPVMSPSPPPASLKALLAYLRGETSRLELSAAQRAALARWLAAQLPAGAPATTAAPHAAVPAGDWLLLQTDGASRGNPGAAAAGIVITAGPAGAELYREGVTLGTLTNNQAEYRALLLGLAAVERLGGRKFEVALDSELIVRQLEGRYKVKNAGLKPLYEQARLALSRFEAWRIRHVPRSENAQADALANEALDSL